VPTVIDPNADPARIAAKLAHETELEAVVPYYLAHYLNSTTESTTALPCVPTVPIKPGSSASSSCPSGTRPADDPATRAVALPLDKLHKQEKDNTCAPASARSVLHQLTGTDFTEAALAKDMQTTSAGTEYPKLEATLNKRQNQDDFFGEPDGSLTPNRLMGQVMGAVLENHAAILNVNQSLLTYWHRTAVYKDPNNPTKRFPQHYNVGYGYSLRDGGSINVGDVAAKAYGEYVVPLEEVTTAVKGNKGLVVR
jgi:hypothetical protein